MPKIISECKNCNKKFEYYDTKTRGIFCSKQCQHSFDYPGSIWKGKNGYLYYQKGRKNKILLHRHILGISNHDKRIVHHKNGDKLNNSLENLEIIETQAEHIKIHNPVTYRWHPELAH